MSTLSFKLYEGRTEGRAAPECRRLLPLKHVMRRRDGSPAPGSAVHPRILHHGMRDSRLITDAIALCGPDAEVRLLGRGFARQADAEGRRVYHFGHAHLYGTGQRVVLNRGGGGVLITFAGQQVQIIDIDDFGVVLRNDVQALP